MDRNIKNDVEVKRLEEQRRKGRLGAPDEYPPEEFAGIVIPKVWKREGRKVSRVATRLSISPKKVRRILSNAGLLEGKDRVETGGQLEGSRSKVGKFRKEVAS